MEAFDATAKWPKCPDARCLERAPNAKRTNPKAYMEWRLNHDCLYESNKQGVVHNGLLVIHIFNSVV